MTKDSSPSSLAAAAKLSSSSLSLVKQCNSGMK